MAKNINHGKFYQDKKSGKWYIDTREKIEGKYRHIHKHGFATKHEAQAAYPSVLEKAREKYSNSKKSQGFIFEDFINEFEKNRSIKVCDSTISTNDYYLVKSYFLPTFSGLSVSEAFCPQTFLAWYDDLASDTRVSETRRNKAIRLAKAMLKYAYGRKYIGAETYQDCDVNCLVLKEPHRKEKERIIWTEAQKTAFLSAIDQDSPDFIMFSLLIEIAPRIGEFLGLTADCFNYENRSIEIKQQVLYDNDGSYKLTDRLKSHLSYRSLPVSEGLANLLKRYIEALGIGPREYLFGPWGSHSVPLSRTELRRKLASYCKAARVPAVNPHAFRHMLSTALSCHYTTTAQVEAGAAILGHSPSVELDTYCHNNTLEKARELMNRLRAQA